MKECYTEALVLGVRTQGERDRVVEFYTKNLGRIEAKVMGGRKITSKLAPHLGMGSVVEARLVFKNQFTLTDVLQKRSVIRDVLEADSEKRFIFDFLKLLYFLRKMTPIGLPDLNVWHRVEEVALRRSADLKIFLKILGHDVRLAKCDGCGGEKIRAFQFEDQVFVCGDCLNKNVFNDIVYIH